jgi:queuosine precursor transporter
MIHSIIKDRPTKLFIFLAGFFIANALIAEIIGVKIFSLEKTIGLLPSSFTLLGESGLSFDLSVGVLPWPIVFIMTDIVNEYYGIKGVRFLSILTAILITFAFLIFFLAIHTSLTAFLVGQLTDARVFRTIKKITGEKQIWARATISTLFSQLVDTVVVSYIYLYFSLGFSFPKVTALAMVGYSYKFLVAVMCTPLIYLIHFLIEKYLGKDQAAKMKTAALSNSL